MLPALRIHRRCGDSDESFPLDLKQLKALGFKDTLALDESDVAVDEENAHIVMRERRRIDKNDNPIERVTAFCLVKGAITACYLGLPAR